MTFKINKIQLLHQKVLVSDLEQGVAVSQGGIIIPDDDMTERGIRERWAKVWAVGPEVDDLKPGEWVLLKHGRWSPRMSFDTPEGSIDLWQIDYPEAVLLVGDERPKDRRKF